MFRVKGSGLGFWGPAGLRGYIKIGFWLLNLHGLLLQGLSWGLVFRV